MSSRLESSVDAGDNGCTGGGISSRYTGRGIGKTPVLTWICVGQGVDSALTTEVLTIVHCAPPSSVTHALVFMGDHSHGEGQIPRTTQRTKLEGAVTVPSRARCSHSGVSSLHHRLQSVWELSVSYLIAFLG